MPYLRSEAEPVMPPEVMAAPRVQRYLDVLAAQAPALDLSEDRAVAIGYAAVARVEQGEAETVFALGEALGFQRPDVDLLLGAALTWLRPDADVPREEPSPEIGGPAW